MLQRLELDAPELQTFLTHDASARSIYKLYPGRSVQAATDEDGNLIWLRYIHTPGNETDGQVVTRMLHVAPAGNSYKAEEITESTDRQTRVAVGTIRSSLFGATDAAGIPDSVTLQMADILSAKIDFLRDLRQGDQFRVVYEARTTAAMPAPDACWRWSSSTARRPTTPSGSAPTARAARITISTAPACAAPSFAPP